MTIPFYKLQLAGNGFILVDTGIEGISPLTSDRYADAARNLCDKRFGVGATAAIFLSPDNTIRIFNTQGMTSGEADDAILCASRFAFDSGRITNHSIVFKTPRGEKIVEALGAHEFRIAVGSPFSILGGRVIESTTPGIVENVERDGVRTAFAAIHLHEDIVVAFPDGLGTLNYASFSALLQKSFPGKTVLPVIARCVTRETILVRANVKRESSACAAAGAALAAAICSGVCEKEAVVLFEQTSQDSQSDAFISRDRDNSRRLAVSWDTEDNEMYVMGTGGYLFEGKFDFAD